MHDVRLLDGLSADRGPADRGADAAHDLTPPDLVPWPDTQLQIPQFNQAVPVPGVNSTADDDGPHLSVDGLRLYFASKRSGGWRIWIATRPSLQDPFGAPVMVPGLGADTEADPTLTDDELTIVFEGSGSNTSGDLFQATRPSITDPFGPRQSLAALNTADSESDAGITGDGLMIAFTSNRPGGPGGSDLWYATRASLSDPFTSPVLLSALCSTAGEQDPVFVGENILLFTSSRPGGEGSGDIYITSRPDAASAFAAPVGLASLNSTTWDGDPFLHTGLRLIVFEHKPAGNDEIYWASY